MKSYDELKAEMEASQRQMVEDHIHLEYPKSVGRHQYWKQIKRTVNGREVDEDDILFIINYVNKHLNLSLSDNLLDLGCGNGKLASYFFEKINKYHGVDFSDYLLEVARTDFFIENKTQYQKLNLRHDSTKIKSLNQHNKVLCYGSFPYFGKNGGQSIIELLGVSKNITNIYLGNIPDSRSSHEFYTNRKINAYDVNDETSAIGVWWAFEDLELLFKSAGFLSEKINLPENYYASNYRFDVHAFR